MGQMKPYPYSLVLLLVFAILSLTQDAKNTGLGISNLASPSSKVTEAPACIQECYRKYGGDFASCPFGKDDILKCHCEWSSENTPRETECIVEECGPDAYIDLSDIVDLSICLPLLSSMGPEQTGDKVETPSGTSSATDNLNGAVAIGWSSGAAAGFIGSVVYIIRMIL